MQSSAAPGLQAHDQSSEAGWRLFLAGLEHRDTTLILMGMERMARAVPPESFAPVKPHDYVPDPMLMGDCAICGNVRDSAAHTSLAETPTQEATNG